MYKHLISEQRYAIEVLLQQKKSNKEIAEAIGVHESTVHRELSRNSGKRGYHSKQAQQYADERKERLPGNRVKPEWVRKRALLLLKEEQWSPKQISGYLKREGTLVSHETIYGWIREDKEAGGDLYKSCRHRLKHRKRPVGQCAKIKGRRSIHDRPKEADGSRFGDWEMDTIVGKDNAGAILTLTERKTNFVMMELLPKGKDAEALAMAAARLLEPYMRHIRTITTDNGSEFAAHMLLTEKLHGVPIYFADPYSSWQKGAIEHANKLIRQYIPKGTVFKELSANAVKNIQFKLNRRPREKLLFESPKTVFFRLLDAF